MDHDWSPTDLSDSAVRGQGNKVPYILYHCYFVVLNIATDKALFFHKKMLISFLFLQ